MTWQASGSARLTLTDRDRTWDGDAAAQRIFKWAGGEDFTPSKAQRAFFAFDDESPENRTSYKLPFADVVNGKLKAVPHAVFAVAAVLEGGRGGVDLPKTVQSKVRKKVEVYYRKMGDDPPWSSR
jgi:hypothetical protein